ncbi:MAG TPA: hypothetical protein VFI28_06650 [Candidatus Limnocylindrales bacterium]|nr:hypothetical protein [Candidatus Limnocylindrales bacterium]
MNANPPKRRAGRSPGRRPGAPAAGVLLVVVAMLVSAACSTAPSPPPTTTAVASQPASAPPSASASASASADPTGSSSAVGLVVVVDDGSQSLGLAGADGALGSLSAPRHPIRQIRAATAGLVAALDDGTLAFGRLRAGSIAWMDGPPTANLAALAADPGGRFLALLDTDRLGQGLPLALEIVPVAGGDGRTITAKELEANGAPAWLADGRIALRAIGRGGRDVLAIVDSATDRTTSVPFDAIDLFASADGRTVALAYERAIRIVPAADLSGDGVAVAVPTDPGAGRVAEVALDPTGGRIAFVLEDDDQTPISIRIATAAAGWRETAHIDVPVGTTRIRIAWAG